MVDSTASYELGCATGYDSAMRIQFYAPGDPHRKVIAWFIEPVSLGQRMQWLDCLMIDAEIMDENATGAKEAKLQDSETTDK